MLFTLVKRISELNEFKPLRALTVFQLVIGFQSISIFQSFFTIFPFVFIYFLLNSIIVVTNCIVFINFDLWENKQTTVFLIFFSTKHNSFHEKRKYKSN